ncbi:hypothetical protein D3C87_266050 [compost metagenome]
MKKQTLLLVLLFGIIFAIAGCKKDNDSSSARLQGRWNLSNFTYEHYIDGKLIPPDPSTSHGTTTSAIVFEGNKYIVYDEEGDIEEQGTFTLRGDIISVKNHQMTLSLPLKWNGNDEFSMSNKYDISIKNKEYEVITSTYSRQK